MKIRFFLLFSIFLRLDLQAQDVPKTFSLRQCIDYALLNNTGIKNATIDEYIAKSRVQEYIGTGLPQLSGNAAYQHANPLRRMFIQKLPNSPFSSFFPTNVPDGTVAAIPNVFQLPNTADASVTLSQLIFSGSFFVGLKAAKTYKELSAYNNQRTKIDVIENVTKAYYMALINVERKNLFDVNISRVDSILNQTRILKKNGFAEDLDVNRLEVTYNNLLTEKKNFDNLIAISSILLRYQMNMPLEEELYLSDKLADYNIDPAITTNDKSAFNNRIEYKLLTTQHKLNNLNYKNNINSGLPSLAFNANMGYFTQTPDLKLQTDRDFYFRYATYTVALNVPLFSGLSRYRRVQQARLEIDKSQNNLIQFERSVELQSRSSAISYNNSIQSLQSEKRNMELAKEVARVTRIKYTSGVGSNLEVVEAESALKTAQINYYNSLYDAIVGKVDYDKSLGNLK